MNETVAFAKLFIENGVSAEAARQVLVRLRRSAELTASVATVVAEFPRITEQVDGDDATFKRFFRQPQIKNIVAVATVLGHEAAHFLAHADELAVGQNLNPPALVTGNDLIALGLRPSPRFKQVLFTVETEQLNGRINTKEEAVEVALAVWEVL